MDCVNGNESPVAVVMVPLPAQGHLNQLLHLSRLISAKGIPVHYTGSTMHNRQAKQRVHGWDPSTISNIHFHDFTIPPFQIPPPDPNASNKFPVHLVPAFDATLHLREPLSKLLRHLSSTSPRVVVIHDALMSFAAEEASLIPNSEAYTLQCVSTFATLYFMWDALGRQIPNGMPHLSLQGLFPEPFAEFAKQQTPLKQLVTGELYNTCRPIESVFSDLLAQEEFFGKKRLWTIGPLNPVSIDTNKGSQLRHKCLDWLDEQPLDSVIYISFGTMTSMSDEEINELAIGLERCEQKFIWALKEADRGDIFAEGVKVRKLQVPDGYEERVQGRGMIVTDWAPQLEILAHPSTGGFLSHCGWNSCMESMSMGVPLATWPMHSDQPMNTILMTKVLKIALEVRQWESREELTSSVTIESAVRKLMISEEGNDMRRRAKELGVVIRQAASQDGTSTAEFNSFIKHISR